MSINSAQYQSRAPMPFFFMLDFSSPAWHQLRRWTEIELEKARLKNDADLTDNQTAALRGEIKVLKRILDLPNQATRGVAAEPDD